MRSLSICALAVAISASALPARSADLDYGVLRGSEEEYVAPADWSGFYVAAHGGYSTTSFGYSRAGQSELGLILQGLAVEAEYAISHANKLRDARAHDGSFGALGGYNIQVDDIVFGIELDYTSLNQKGHAEGDIGRQVTLKSGIIDNHYLATQVRTTLEDYGTVRGRVGYAFGSFLPYVTAGAAFGRAVNGTTVRAQLEEYTTDQNGDKKMVGTLDKSAGSIKERYRFGAAFGVGAEYLITQNVFARAEYQYVMLTGSATRASTSAPCAARSA